MQPQLTKMKIYKCTKQKRKKTIKLDYFSLGINQHLNMITIKTVSLINKFENIQLQSRSVKIKLKTWQAIQQIITKLEQDKIQPQRKIKDGVVLRNIIFIDCDKKMLKHYRDSIEYNPNLAKS